MQEYVQKAILVVAGLIIFFYIFGCYFKASCGTHSCGIPDIKNNPVVMDFSKSSGSPDKFKTVDN